MSSPTLIVGAGLGGLAAAIRLAAQGRRVIVFEKNERVGGKLNLLERDGYTFDTGPSLLTMPWIIRDLFAAAGRRMEDYLDLMQIDPTCRYFWPDGTNFDAWQRLPQLVQEIERLEPRDVTGFYRFMAYAATIYGAVADTFMLRPFDGLRDMLDLQLMQNGPRIDALRTMDAAVRSYFRSPYLRQVFNRYATYNGSSPYQSPATFNVISYIEFAEGGWYVRGGMYELGRALLQLAQELGVEVRTSTPVQEVCIEAGQTRGVCLANGQHVDGAQVVVNADPRYSYNGVVGSGPLVQGQPATATRLQRLEPSCSGFILFLGIKRVYEQLRHHNIFFSQDYQREFAAIFQKRVPAPDPTIYINASSVTDAHHAPPGHMNLFVLVNAPAVDGRVQWEREAAGYRDLVIRKLERMGLAGLSQQIAVEEIWTPAELESRYNAAGGAIYGLASNNPFVAFMRPPLRARHARRLYFVGGGTHPGGGIPLVLLSGKAVAERIALDSG
ncbi:MAG: phytoene desaturase family protein [Chloroflexaceae bacterium]|jgi:phytoene desaturase|nr:phytoene desaturase family protein [Chloroflexaceae bacterium]